MPGVHVTNYLASTDLCGFSGGSPASFHLQLLWRACTVLQCAGVLTPEVVSRAGASAFAGAGAVAGACAGACAGAGVQVQVQGGGVPFALDLRVYYLFNSFFCVLTA